MNGRASEYYWGILGLQKGASGGCRRMQEAAGVSRRLCEGFTPLQGGTGPSMEESEALRQHLLLKRAGPDLRMAL